MVKLRIPKYQNILEIQDSFFRGIFMFIDSQNKC